MTSGTKRDKDIRVSLKKDESGLDRIYNYAREKQHHSDRNNTRIVKTKGENTRYRQLREGGLKGERKKHSDQPHTLPFMVFRKVRAKEERVRKQIKKSLGVGQKMKPKKNLKNRSMKRKRRQNK